MGGKRWENRCDMLPNIEKATVCRLKRKKLKKKVCRLKRNGESSSCSWWRLYGTP